MTAQSKGRKVAENSLSGTRRISQDGAKRISRPPRLTLALLSDWDLRDRLQEAPERFEMRSGRRARRSCIVAPGRAELPRTWNPGKAAAPCETVMDKNPTGRK